MGLNGVHYNSPAIAQAHTDVMSTSQLLQDNYHKSVAIVNNNREELQGAYAGAYEDMMNMINTKYDKLGQTVQQAGTVLDQVNQKVGEADSQAAGQYGRN
ncbi:WXG100 family type VII secretion target [Mycobacteroides abscessus subsp. abscessus]|uniref:WXG100 family type VII secretion target n=1 Tax=Mycobacteroides abscessus TaxID=36809 RepID=UPI00092B0A50|nr:hypothetical protein [Mycobacteroides abscessus]SHS17936.1 WXG100 family type VII secretion target [Mycobacteroides abscessus subsp. abscessus]SKO03397.1 WXG100 family type VII secretion target [Mycobacteroides abscessus subsp. massiliense]SKO11774.1 WXG100 family type VII secretion target [Mycobacteroides abscessus subsp. massiliense]